MKRFALALFVAFALITTAVPASAWGPRPPVPPPYRGGYHHHSNAGDVIAGVVVGGLLLGGIAAALSPPPPPVQYVAAPPQYPPPTQVVVQQPRVCVEERMVSGEYQYNPATGASVWIAFPYPMMRQIQVPCR